MDGMRSALVHCFVCAGAILSAACGFDIQYTQTNAPPHAMAARPPESVEVAHIAPNDRRFVETGTIDETGYWGGGTEHADQLLRQKAAEVGCDALVIQGYVQGGARYRGICLAYLPDH
jgi:hypothetical protein